MTKQVALFEGTGSNGAIDLWASDGTAAGTVPILPTDVYTGSRGASAGGLLGNISGSPTQADFTQFGSIALFTGIDANGVVGLWRTDGTAAGTYEIIVNGAPSYGVTYPWNTGYAVLGTTVYFAGDNQAASTDLWSTQGTTATTGPITVANAFAAGLNPTDFIVFDGGSKLLFTGTVNPPAGSSAVEAQQEFLISGGSISAIAMPNGITVQAAEAAALGTDVVFFNQNESQFPAFYAGSAIGSGYASDGLWITDGTATGTRPLVGLPGMFVDGMTVLGSFALFRGTGGALTTDLWITDGTAAGTARILPANANAAGLLAGVTPNFARLSATQILFEGNDAAGVLGLWSTDGTAAHTYEITVAGANAAGLFASSSAYVSVPNFAVVNGRVLFYGLDAAGHVGLWSSDGTAAGTTELSVAGANVNGLVPGDLTAITLCFAVGTRIATETGEVPVEQLHAGDHVLTLGGAKIMSRPARWVGRFSVDLARHPAPERAAPVRIRAHAFAENVPHRDVLLSPDHAVLFRGALFHARALCNGASVVQEFPRRISYAHVELDTHCVLFAEGLPAESYLDLGTRGCFDGEAGTRPLFPDLAAAAWTSLACAPLVLDGPRLAAARAHLAERINAARTAARSRRTRA